MEENVVKLKIIAKSYTTLMGVISEVKCFKEDEVKEEEIGRGAMGRGREFEQDSNYVA